MKRLFVFVALMAAIVSTLSAQSPLLATLSHDGEISTFFGEKAFVDAYNAATDGDIITLGAGRFVRPSDVIRKSLTIRGCGMDKTFIYGGTILFGEQNQEITFEDLQFLSFLRHYVVAKGKFKLVRCKADYLTLGEEYDNEVVMSIIDKLVYGSGTFVSSYIKTYKHSGYVSMIDKSQFDNCTLLLSSNYSVKESNFKNCILQLEGNNKFTSPVIMTSSVCIGDESNMNGVIVDSDFPCKYLPSGTEFLKDGTTTYELRDDLANLWIGTDGTQVGMHGGPIPFDPRLSTPIIKKFNVSSKTSADGKLSVDIEVDNID